ncbi:hypothetical protein HK102_003486, partial [Quaeritorhiza haematococci]
MTAAEPPLVLASISLTHVQYDPTLGPIAKILAYASLVPIALLVSYATLILFRRDLATMSMLLGQLANELTNAVMKELISETRPT